MQHLMTAIGGPRECLRVDTPDAYRRWARRTRMAMHLPAALTASSTPIPAHVSDGRWVADCPCGGAGLVEPDWGFTICVSCGIEHRVALPRDWPEVEDVLLARPSPTNRHFFPRAAVAHRLVSIAARRGVSVADAAERETAAAHLLGAMPVRAETTADLRRENLEHGLPVRREATS